MPYLICDKCNIYYEIEDKNEMKNFHTCECGNELQYFNTIEKYMKRSRNITNSNTTSNFYTNSKKDILTFEAEIFRDHEEVKKEERSKRELNYRIKHAIAERNEKLSNSYKIKDYKPQIVNELKDINEKKKLLNEIELLEDSKGENVTIKRNLEKQIYFDGLTILILGFIGTIFIWYAFYLFLMAVSTMIFASVLLIVSTKKYYSRTRLRGMYMLNGINLAIFCIISLIFIILSIINGSHSLFSSSTNEITFMVIIYGSSSYFMFCRAALPDYPEKLEDMPLDSTMHHIDKNNPIYGKQKVE